MGLRVLDERFKAEGKTRGDRVEEGDHVDSGEVCDGGVDGTQVERVVRAEVVVFDLDHRVAGGRGELRIRKRWGSGETGRLRTHLCLDLGSVNGAPCLVGSCGHGPGMVDTSLQKGL